MAEALRLNEFHSISAWPGRCAKPGQRSGFAVISQNSPVNTDSPIETAVQPSRTGQPIMCVRRTPVMGCARTAEAVNIQSAKDKNAHIR